MKVVIIGTNHAGTIAARTLKKINPDLQVVTYDRNDNISFLGCGIALWVKGEFDDPEGLFYASPEMLKREGIEVHMNHECINIDTEKREITLHDIKNDKKFVDIYDKMIYALGSWPITPPIPGIDLNGVKIIKWFQHGREVKQANQNPDIKKVVVCGAGYIGVELVDAFHAAGKEVTLIDICDRIMPNYYDREFTDKIEKSMAEAGVHIKTGQKVHKFTGVDGKVTHVITDKEKIEADMVIWCVGFRPITNLLRDEVELSKTGHIVIDQCMRTSDQNVYAIGDCVQVFNNAMQKAVPIALATTAIRTGTIAAINIAKGCHLNSSGFQGSNAICIFGWSLASTGMSEEACQRHEIDYEKILIEDYDRPEFMKEKYKITFKVVFDKESRKIIGAQVGSTANHTEIIHMMSLAIQKQVTIDELPLIDMFFLPHFNKPFNYVTQAGLKAIGLEFKSKK